jgi:DNA polymerase-4
MSARQVLHLDLDAFFASVEQRDDPSLRGKPVLVGGSERRGVVTAASYEAREFGCRSAMPMAEAMRRCPHAIVCPGRRDAYAEASDAVFDIFRRYTPLVEGLSIDEAFLDVTGSRQLFGTGEEIAARIRREVRAEIGLTVSAGVAPSKFVAKIASDLDKPDGLVVVPEGQVREFLAPLPVERMWGVGPKAARRMHFAGIETIGDLARAEPARLENLLGAWGAQVHFLANGIDERPVHPGHAAKSVGAEETFMADLRHTAELEARLLSQSQRVARRLWSAGLCGGTVVVKVKYADFTSQTKRMQLPEAVFDTDSIHSAAKELLSRFAGIAQRGVRLTGVTVTGLMAGPPPRTLFPDQTKERRQTIEEVSNAIRARFGRTSMTRATLLGDHQLDRPVQDRQRRSDDD